MKLPIHKNTTRMIGLASCLLFSSLGCSTFATYATLSSGTVALVTQEQAGQKTLEDFGQRLETRLAGVWQEIRGLAGER
jgi:predicted aminopeptidase